MTLADLNALSREEFVRRVGPAFEHSPWIAERAWAQRPFANVEALHEALCATVQKASETEQLALMRAHPDLAGRLALAGQLTRESTKEQASAGLHQLTSGEQAAFQEHNSAYRQKFGFPFIICARLNDKATVLQAFQARLPNARAQEIQTALAEIYKIAGLRLRDLVKG